MPDFAAVAPYLKDPLVLAGFALFLFFGALRFVVKRYRVTQKIAGIAVLRLVVFGFILALTVIILGFGLRYMEVLSDTKRVAAEHRAALAEQANRSLQTQLARLTEDRNTAQEQSKALTAAVTALAAQQGPGIDDALEALANDDTAKAKVIFQRIADAQATNVKKAAAAHRHLGALAYLSDTNEALTAYRRATELDPDNLNGWIQLGELYLRTGRYDDAIRAHGLGLALAEANNDRWAIAAQTGNLAGVYSFKGDLARAEKMLRHVLTMQLELGNKQGMATTYSNLSNVYSMRYELVRAEDMIQKSLAINKELKQKQGMAIDYGNLGVIYGKRRKLNQAEDMFRKALKIYEMLEAKTSMALMYGNLGNVYGIRNELDRAEGMYRKALGIYEKHAAKPGMALMYGNLGVIYKNRRDYDRAIMMYEKALAIDKDLGRKLGIATVYVNIGNLHKLRGDFDQARMAWKKSVSLFRELNAAQADIVQAALDRLGGPPDK
jgi:tetratricopeptide (TPR) repeat protein